MRYIILLIAIACVIACSAQSTLNTVNIGLDRHDLFYAGESKSRDIYKQYFGKYLKF